MLFPAPCRAMPVGLYLVKRWLLIRGRSGSAPCTSNKLSYPGSDPSGASRRSNPSGEVSRLRARRPPLGYRGLRRKQMMPGRTEQRSVAALCAWPSFFPHPAHAHTPTLSSARSTTSSSGGTGRASQTSSMPSSSSSPRRGSTRCGRRSASTCCTKARGPT